MSDFDTVIFYNFYVSNRKGYCMKDFLQRIKDLFKKRVVILGTVFGVLLLSWYMTVPIKVKNCSVGNIQYAHKYFNTCSDKVMFVYNFPDYNTLYNIQNNSDKNKIYTRNNIAGHIATNRYIVNNNNTPFKFLELSWVFVLETIGHYDEAINYLKIFDNTDYDYNILYSQIKENCYTEPYFANNKRIYILGCKIASPVTTLLAKKEIKKNNNVQAWIKRVEDSRNDIIKMPKFRMQKAKLANEAIDNGEYDLAYKYIDEYYNEQKGILYSSNSYHSYVQKLYFKLGMAYIGKKDYKKALECFENILEIQDYNYKAHEKLEICYRKLGNIQKADEHARIMKELLAL